MTRISKSVYSLLAIILMFFAINYQWTKAAYAWSINSEPCPTALIEKAKKRLIPLFGSISSAPLINCQGQTENPPIAPGYVNFAPFLPEIITLNFHGRSEDVIAHEYAHAELSTRLGFFPRLLHIPIWFDEGLAMQVDLRSDYSETALLSYLNNNTIKPHKLLHIASVSGFFQKGVQGKYHYALSRCVVRQWLRAGKNQQPRDLIKTIGWFGQFPYPQFDQYEKFCMKGI